MTDTFYSSIAPVDNFQALADLKSYAPLPDDWCVVAADIVNSTVAIEAGNYKAVNTIGVSVIAATINILRPVEIPYLFGGDGALLCIPGRALAKVREALGSTIAMSYDAFKLELRAAIIPVSYIRSNGHEILVARHRVSPHYVQCALFGGGSGFAERMLKSRKLPSEYLVASNPDGNADYSGLECRWREIPSPDDETVALIVEPRGEPGRALALQRTVMDLITEVYGEAERFRPVTEDRLRIAFSSTSLRNESLIKTWKASLPSRLRSAAKLRGALLLGWFLMKFGIRFNNADWGSYKKDLVSNTDFRKFDGSLRLILSGKEKQRRMLEESLSKLRDRGEILYGMHVSQSALMTCLVENRQSVHAHFVDAAGGGYAFAAKALKQSAENYSNSGGKTA